MSGTSTRPTPVTTGRGAAWTRVAPAVFALAWGGNHFTPLLHLYEDLGHYSPWQANLLLGMYVFGLIPGLLVASALSDRLGRKPVLAAGLAAGAAGSVLLAAGLHLLPLLCLGRALAGIGVGIAMSVGTSWITELSRPPHDPRATAAAAARRASLTLTLGFAIGAAATGVLAQWGPIPAQLPYFAHLALSTAALPAVLAAPETHPRARGTAPRGSTPPLWSDLRVPQAGHRTFTRNVLPAAPWIFAAAGVAYAIMPAIAAPVLGDWTTLYATALTVLTLGSGALIQPWVARIDQRVNALRIGLILMTCGMVLAVVAALLARPWFALLVALALGSAYGITMVAGLTRVQRIAGPDDLAGLTGVYYALAYTGFLLPTVLAALLPVAPYAATLAVVALLCAGCLLLAGRR